MSLGCPGLCQLSPGHPGALRTALLPSSFLATSGSAGALNSALSGLVPATSGSAGALGVDVLREVDDVLREELRLCPQHNIVFPELTAGALRW